jgi:hypothetical protein
MDFGLSFRMKYSVGFGTFPAMLGVAGRHRAYPSVTLDKFPYVVVFVARTKSYDVSQLVSNIFSLFKQWLVE